MNRTQATEQVDRELTQRANALGVPAVVVQWIRMGELDDQLEAGRLRFTTGQRQAEVEALATWYYEALDEGMRQADATWQRVDRESRDGRSW